MPDGAADQEVGRPPQGNSNHVVMTSEGAADPLQDVRTEHAETHRMLAQALAEIRELRQFVEHRERVPRAPRLHVRVAGPLLREISAGVGSAAWTGAALIAESAHDRPLQAAIVTATGPIDVGTTRRLGRLLAQVEGVRINGLVVERVDVNGRDGATWRVLRE
jgi:hypothetical protein